MVRSRSEEIRRRIAKRRKSMNKSGTSQKSKHYLTGDDEKYGFNHLISYEDSGGGEETHPLFKKEIFLFKFLASACLVLVVAILFRNHSDGLDPTRSLVKKAMDKEFQFASVSNWYEDNFGKPLALLPFTEKKQTGEQLSESEFAVPASGRILENFEKNGQGVMIETGKGAQVEAMNEGIITFAGIKEGLGKTVIIQHSDQTESWYGNLDVMKVNLYEYIEKGKEVGTVSTVNGENEATKGSYYFAIKKGDQFIDPIQVIQFD
jgi:stage IV sporulation protein FA